MKIAYRHYLSTGTGEETLAEGKVTLDQLIEDNIHDDKVLYEWDMKWVTTRRLRFTQVVPGGARIKEYVFPGVKAFPESEMWDVHGIVEDARDEALEDRILVSIARNIISHQPHRVTKTYDAEEKPLRLLVDEYVLGYHSALEWSMSWSYSSNWVLRFYNQVEDNGYAYWEVQFPRDLDLEEMKSIQSWLNGLRTVARGLVGSTPWKISAQRKQEIQERLSEMRDTAFNEAPVAA